MVRVAGLETVFHPKAPLIIAEVGRWKCWWWSSVLWHLWVATPSEKDDVGTEESGRGKGRDGGVVVRMRCESRERNAGTVQNNTRTRLS